ncbi:MAG: hypothetical protein AB1696_05290 [Planctomycetota bacterium]
MRRVKIVCVHAAVGLLMALAQPLAGQDQGKCAEIRREVAVLRRAAIDALNARKPDLAIELLEKGKERALTVGAGLEQKRLLLRLEYHFLRAQALCQKGHYEEALDERSHRRELMEETKMYYAGAERGYQSFEEAVLFLLEVVGPPQKSPQAEKFWSERKEDFKWANLDGDKALECVAIHRSSEIDPDPEEFSVVVVFDLGLDGVSHPHPLRIIDTKYHELSIRTDPKTKISYPVLWCKPRPWLENTVILEYKKGLLQIKEVIEIDTEEEYRRKGLERRRQLDTEEAKERDKTKNRESPDKPD